MGLDEEENEKSRTRSSEMRKIGKRSFMLVRSSVEMVKVGVEIELVLIFWEGGVIGRMMSTVFGH